MEIPALVMYATPEGRYSRMECNMSMSVSPITVPPLSGRPLRQYDHFQHHQFALRVSGWIVYQQGGSLYVSYETFERQVFLFFFCFYVYCAKTLFVYVTHYGLRGAVWCGGWRGVRFVIYVVAETCPISFGSG